MVEGERCGAVPDTGVIVCQVGIIGAGAGKHRQRIIIRAGIDVFGHPGYITRVARPECRQGGGCPRAAVHIRPGKRAPPECSRDYQNRCARSGKDPNEAFTAADPFVTVPAPVETPAHAELGILAVEVTAVEPLIRVIGPVFAFQ